VDDLSTIVPARRAIAALGDWKEKNYHGRKIARGADRCVAIGDEETIFKAAMSVFCRRRVYGFLYYYPQVGQGFNVSWTFSLICSTPCATQRVNKIP
jgi:hypothetical protein